VSLGLLALSLLGPADVPGLGGGAFVDLRGSAAGLFRPSFRVEGVLVSAQPRFGGSLAADWTWYLARLEGCPSRIHLGAAFELVPCAVVDAGAFHSAGIGIAPSATDLRSWVAPGAALRLAWRTAPRWTTELTASLLVPVDAYHFDVVRPGTGTLTQVHEMAPVAGSFALGLSYAP
jgi:hypothetical protein